MREPLGPRGGERPRDQPLDQPVVRCGERRGERGGGPGVALVLAAKLGAMPGEERARLDEPLVARGHEDCGRAPGERQHAGAKAHPLVREPVEAREGTPIIVVVRRMAIRDENFGDSLRFDPVLWLVAAEERRHLQDPRLHTHRRGREFVPGAVSRCFRSERSYRCWAEASNWRWFAAAVRSASTLGSR